MGDIAGWIAPAATMIAAMMTAANLGARLTGWGFVVFTIGSIGWIVVAVTTDQQNLLWTNGWLLIVNSVGVWRWLGRQAAYEEGGKAATSRSVAQHVPTLFATGSLAGTDLIGAGGGSIGSVVEGMISCDNAALAYVVVSEGGLGGVGERLHALHPDELRYRDGNFHCDLDRNALARRRVLCEDDWPLRIRPDGSED